MTTFGYSLSSEEHPGSELVRGAVLAEQAGFRGLWISDHFHPWLEDQGESPFVWAVLGAIANATSEVTLTTAVTCPTVRIHPAIIAQAAATTQELSGGRFSLGVGSGEALNEHILGDLWPEADVRLEMLEEAIEVLRRLWTGELVSHHGRHYTVDTARLYTLPETPPKILVSGFGGKSIELAARVGDGFVTTQPDADAIKAYRDQGGTGPTQAAVKVCWAPTEAEGVRTAHRTWRNEQLPGQLAQELRLPAFFEQASQLVTEDMMAEKIACGPDPEKHLRSVQAYVDAGFDEVYIAQMGPDQEGMIQFYEKEILPRLG